MTWVWYVLAMSGVWVGTWLNASRPGRWWQRGLLIAVLSAFGLGVVAGATR